MNKLSILAITLLFAATFFACQKENEDNQENIKNEYYSIAEDAVIAEDYAEDIESELEEILSQGIQNAEVQSRSCRTVTVEPDDNSFPRTITIDFGDGCNTPGGKIKTGKIIVVISGPRNQAGSTRTTTFDDHTVDNVLVEGNFTVTNNGNHSFSRDVDMVLTFPDESTISWESTKSVTQIAGQNTPPRLDDIFEIEGNASGVNRSGNTFSSQITETLIRRGNCRWITNGIREVNRNGQIATIDYGFGPGVCNNLAEVTLPNGNTRVIRIERRW